MSAFTALWLPTLASAVVVFILSSIIHMVLPFWHRGDYGKIPNEGAVLDALRPFNIPRGEYFAPRPAEGEDMRSASFLEKMNRGPIVIMTVSDPGMPSLARPLALWFVYSIVVAALAGHVAYPPLRETTDLRMVFHTIALTSFLGYVAALWQGVIWFRRSTMTALKATIDGTIYALATGWVFCYFWPKG